MRTALVILLWTASAAGAWAQVDTPKNCHWVALPDDKTTSEMWCRAEDGQARPTGRLMRQGPADAWDGCPKGLTYDGAHCVSEWEAMEASAAAPAPAPAKRAERPKARKPDIYMHQNRDGRYERGVACTDAGAGGQVQACKAIPHH